MERKIEEFYQKWKKDKSRKPLMIYGAKQIGKTYSVLEFGKREYKNIAYFNTENNKKLSELFRRERTVDKIVLNLAIISGETIFLCISSLRRRTENIPSPI